MKTHEDSSYICDVVWLEPWWNDESTCWYLDSSVCFCLPENQIESGARISSGLHTCRHLSACKLEEASQWVSWFGFSFWIKPISFILKIIQHPHSMVPNVNQSLATPRGFWVVLNIGGMGFVDALVAGSSQSQAGISTRGDTVRIPSGPGDRQKRNRPPPLSVPPIPHCRSCSRLVPWLVPRWPYGFIWKIGNAKIWFIDCWLSVSHIPTKC